MANKKWRLQHHRPFEKGTRAAWLRHYVSFPQYKNLNLHGMIRSCSYCCALPERDNIVPSLPCLRSLHPGPRGLMTTSVPNSVLASKGTSLVVKKLRILIWGEISRTPPERRTKIYWSHYTRTLLLNTVPPLDVLVAP